MALPTNHAFYEVCLTAYSTQIGSPASGGVCYVRAPFKGRILKIILNQSGAVTGSGTLTAAINGTAVTGGVISYTGGSAGTAFTATPTAAYNVLEDDVVSLTPAGATGSQTGWAQVVFRKGT